MSYDGPIRYGKKLVKPDDPRRANVLSFGRYFTPPDVPPAPQIITPAYARVPMFGNDRLGDCVQCSAAHMLMEMRRRAGRDPNILSEQSVIDTYSASTYYRPWLPFSDRGTDMLDFSRFLFNRGLKDKGGQWHKFGPPLTLPTGNVDVLMRAVNIFKAVMIGLVLDEHAEADFRAGRRWTYDPRARDSVGHGVCCVGRNSSGDLLVYTWDRVHAMSPQYYAKRSDEAHVSFSRELLNQAGLSPNGFNESQLLADMAALGG